jgi:hypothetical protein
LCFLFLFVFCRNKRKLRQICPTCKKSLPAEAIRNRTLERLSENFRGKCNFQCGMPPMPLSRLKKHHQAECKNRPIPCPSWDDSIHCDFCGTAAQVTEHVFRMHSQGQPAIGLSRTFCVKTDTDSDSVSPSLSLCCFCSSHQGSPVRIPFPYSAEAGALRGGFSIWRTLAYVHGHYFEMTIEKFPKGSCFAYVRILTSDPTSVFSYQATVTNGLRTYEHRAPVASIFTA